MRKILLLLLLLPIAAYSQDYSLLQDKVALKEVEEITELIYNNQHEAAEKELAGLQQMVPLTHPVYPMLRALNLYWKDAPMNTSPIPPSNSFQPVFCRLTN